MDKRYTVFAKRTGSPGRIFEKVDHRPLDIVALMKATPYGARPRPHGKRRPTVTKVAR